MRAGVAEVLPLEKLRAFSVRELRELICGVARDSDHWNRDNLTSYVRPGYRYSRTSKPYLWLIDELVDMTAAGRRRFLAFVTSCPNLPRAGFSALLNGPIVVDSTDGHMCTARTCTNQLRLPRYDNREALRAGLRLALKWGSHGFELQ